MCVDLFFFSLLTHIVNKKQEKVGLEGNTSPLLLVTSALFIYHASSSVFFKQSVSLVKYHVCSVAAMFDFFSYFGMTYTEIF